MQANIRTAFIIRHRMQKDMRTRFFRAFKAQEAKSS